VGGFIVAFLQSLSLFGTPAILGLPAGIHTITTQIWTFFQYPPRLDLAAAFSVPLLIATMALIALQKKILGRRGFSTVGGKGGQRRLVRLAGKLPCCCSCYVFSPFRCFCPTGFSKGRVFKAWRCRWTGTTSLNNFSFALFQFSDTRGAIVNTFELGILTATADTGRHLDCPLPTAIFFRLALSHFFALAPL
jgi:iron(III) transport system permease protein